MASATPTTAPFTAADNRAINEIDDLIASLSSWKRSIQRVGYDRNYALDHRIAAMDAAAVLFECDALTKLADEDRPSDDPDASLYAEADHRYELARDAFDRAAA